jgi:hypothetical protein
MRTGKQSTNILWLAQTMFKSVFLERARTSADAMYGNSSGGRTSDASAVATSFSLLAIATRFSGNEEFNGLAV